MDEDFSDVINKFSSILKEKDIDLGSITSKDTTSSVDDDFNIDVDTILKLKTIMGGMNKNKNHPRTKLLKSLSPYLEDTKKEKLEQYIKLANLSSVLDMFDNDVIKKFTDSDYDFILLIILFLMLF